MKRIFVVGCPRSGTTVLQRCLASHPDAISSPETGFFRQLGGNRQWALLMRLGLVRGDRARRAFRQLSAVSADILSDPQTYAQQAWLRTESASRQFQELMDQWCMANGKTMWIEKTPRHIYYASSITRYLPDAIVLHVVRDGRSTVASIRDRSMRYPDRFGDESDPRFGVKLWNRAIRTGLSQYGNPRTLTVFLDELTRAPEPYLRGLCKTLGIPFSDAMMSDTGTASIRHEYESWKDNSYHRIEPPRSKFHDVFSPKEKDWIDNHLDMRSYEALRKLVGASDEGVRKWS